MPNRWRWPGGYALAIAEIGSLSERRIALMMDGHMSQLPPPRQNGGVNSGFMIARVTAAQPVKQSAVAPA